MRLALLLPFVNALIFTCRLGRAETAMEDTAHGTITFSKRFCDRGWFRIRLCQVLCNRLALFKCEGPPTSTYKYYATCGDPVCGGWRSKGDIPLCPPGVQLGVSCANPNYICDPKDNCNSLVKCTDSDPTTQPGGCPISSRQSKRDIAYLDRSQVQDLARSLLSFNLATWNYKHDAVETGRRLGFVIEDVQGANPGVVASSLFDGSSPAIDEKRGMVDLYGFLSMAVATLQTQQREIDALRVDLEILLRKAAATTPPLQCQENTMEFHEII